MKKKERKETMFISFYTHKIFKTVSTIRSYGGYYKKS